MLRKPMTGIPGCCARVASGQAAAATPIRVMNCRRLMIPSLGWGRILPHHWAGTLLLQHSKIDRGMSEMGQGRRSGTAQMCFRSMSVSRPSGDGTNGLLSATKGLMHRSKPISIRTSRRATDQPAGHGRAGREFRAMDQSIRPKSLTLATASPGGVYYVYGEALAQADSHCDQAKLRQWSTRSFVRTMRVSCL
jgi:hypothetical protein